MLTNLIYTVYSFTRSDSDSAQLRQSLINVFKRSFIEALIMGILNPDFDDDRGQVLLVSINLTRLARRLAT